MDPRTTKTIVVEDHEIFRKYLKTFVEQVDHCKIVAEASDGNEALDTIKNVPADLIVLDLSLPRLSGIRVLKEAKKISQTKILVISMHTDKDVVQTALDAGADGFCQKDMGVKVLEKAILETLDGKRPVYAVMDESK